MPADRQGAVECSRCQAAVSLDDAAMLNKRNSKGLWRYLCDGCLENIRVPRGYELKRNLSFLRGGAAAPDATDGPVPEADDGTPGPGPSRRDPSVIADFRGQVVTAEMPRGILSPGRILMNGRQLILATDDHRTAVPFGAIRDVVPNHVSESTRDDYDDIVTIAYRRGNRDGTAFVGANEDALDSFLTVLFKALLRGTTVRFRHPVCVGGRPRESPVRTGRLRIRTHGLDVSGADVPASIELDRVIEARRSVGRWTDAGRPVLSVSQLRDGRVLRSEFVLPGARDLNLLRRFTESVAAGRRKTVDRVDPSRPELQCLVGLYALGGGADLSSLLDLESDRLADLLAALAERGLVEDRADGVSLTTTGRVAVHDRIDGVAGTP